MKIKEMNRFVTFITGGWAVGITLAPFGIYIKESFLKKKNVINHEIIHWKQQMEMLIIFFYIWYLLEWGIKYLIHGNLAYYYISFEREAYKYESDPEYLSKRKHFAWFKLLKL